MGILETEKEKQFLKGLIESEIEHEQSISDPNYMILDPELSPNTIQYEKEQLELQKKLAHEQEKKELMQRLGSVTNKLEIARVILERIPKYFDEVNNWWLWNREEN